MATIEAELRQDLESRHGVMLGGQVLWASLGYPTADAFRQAFIRGVVPVPVFPLPKRRGKFALARDVAHWLAEQRIGASEQKMKSSKPTRGGATVT